MISKYLQNAVVDLAFCYRCLVQWLPKHGAELIDIIHLDVNHGPEWRKDWKKEGAGREGVGKKNERMQESGVEMIDWERDRKWQGKKRWMEEGREKKKISKSLEVIEIDWVLKYFWGLS